MRLCLLSPLTRRGWARRPAERPASAHKSHPPRPRPGVRSGAAFLNSELHSEQWGRARPEEPSRTAGHTPSSPLSAPPATRRLGSGGGTGAGLRVHGAGFSTRARATRGGTHGFPQGRQRLKGPERNITQQVCISGGRKRLEVSLDLNFGGGQDPVPPDLPLKGQRSPLLLTLLSRLRGPLGLGGAALPAVFGFAGPGSQRRRGTGSGSRSAAPPSPALDRPGAHGREAPGFTPWTEGSLCAKLAQQRGRQVQTGAAPRARLILSH